MEPQLTPQGSRLRLALRSSGAGWQLFVVRSLCRRSGLLGRARALLLGVRRSDERERWATRKRPGWPSPLEGRLRIGGLLRWVLGVLAVPFVAGCVTAGSQSLTFREDSFVSQYDQIRQVLIEEARNNGFGALQQEVKPSELNGWKGLFYFTARTPYGEDNLTVKLERVGGRLEINVIAGAMRASADGFLRAINSRLGRQ